MAIGHTLKVLINCVPTVSDHIESRFVVLKSPDRDRFIKGEDGKTLRPGQHFKGQLAKDSLKYHCCIII